MTFYGDMRDIATELLTEFNQGVIRLIRITPGGGPDYDPGEPTETPYAFNGATRGVQQKYVDGTNIVASDMQATLEVRSDVIPNMSDKIEVDGQRYEIISVKPIPPSGETVANVVIFRK